LASYINYRYFIIRSRPVVNGLLIIFFVISVEEGINVRLMKCVSVAPCCWQLCVVVPAWKISTR